VSPHVQNIAERIVPILRRRGIRKAGVFGSIVRGEDSDQSDIDVLVELPRGLSLLDFVSIKLELERTLGRKVDLIEYAGLKPRIRERILREEVAIL
jgi:hypothetical protein